jgi:PAS domain S-box-containing protein
MEDEKDATIEELRRENARLRARLEARGPSRYEDLINSVEGIVWEADPATFDFTFVSREAERLLGHATELWYTRGFWEGILHPEDRRWAVDYCMQSTARCERHEFEYRVIAADGRVVWLRDIVTVVVDDARRPVLLRGVMFDVTDRRRAEEAYLESQFFLEKAQEIAHVGHWVSDADTSGGALLWSEETCRIFGVPRSEFDGRVETFFERVHSEDREAVAEASRAAIAGESPYDVQHRIVRPDGTERWVHEVADVIRDDDGKPVRLVGVVQDVTEGKRLEEQLVQAQKMEAIGRLAGGVAHDFNNLLTVISGYSSMAIQMVKAGDPLHTPLEEIRKAGQRASELTRQLLAFSRKQILQPKVIDLNETVVAMGKMIERLIGEDIELCIRPDPGLGPVKVDPGQIEQIIVNLAVNARDAMPAGGRLTIETNDVEVDGASESAAEGRSAGSYARLDISDTGAGMDAATVALIFEPFFTTKELGKGTGLGLSTVYGIVRQSGGWIEVESAPDLGTVFRIYLPTVRSSAGAEADREAAARSARGTETVLVVEDQADVRKLAVRSLALNGYAVLQAADADEAMRVCATHGAEIHLLLTDMVMPRVGGKQLAERLSAAWPSLKVLFMSGYPDGAAVDPSAAGAAPAFLAKPFTPDELASKVRETLDL